MRLNFELLASLLECRKTFLGESWQINMDGSSHSCSQIGWTGVNVPVLLVQHELLPGLLLDDVTHSSDATSKTIKYRLDITSGLHGDDVKAVFDRLARGIAAVGDSA